MSGYVSRRLAQALLVTWIVSVITFVLSRTIPGGAKAVLGKTATPAQIEQFNLDMGYNESLLTQYRAWIENLLHADFGYSYHLNAPVADAIGAALPRTALLLGMSVMLALVVAIPLGTLQATRHNGLLDRMVGTVSFLAYATPSFLVGILLVTVFAVKLGWVSAAAPGGESVSDIISQPRDLILPVFTLAFPSIALYTRYVRSSVLDNLGADFVRTARAKGRSRRGVLFSHVVPNSLTSVVTILGLSVPALLTGAVIVEQVFNYQGMGLLFWTAARYSDYQTQLAIVVLAAVATVVGNLLADLAYTALDPRVRP